MKALRLAIPLALTATLAACGGGGSGSVLSPIFGGSPVTQSCQPGASVQLADPQAFQTNATNVGSVTIVADGDSNALHNDPQNWYVYLIDNTGQQINGGPLNPVSDTSGPHPFPSDFYYASQLPQTLPSGYTYTAYLMQQNQYCNAVPLQSFSTQ